MSKWRIRRFAYLMMVTPTFVVSACASPRKASPKDPLAFGAQASTEISVRNHNWEAMTIFANRGGALVRLGIVDGLSERTFKIPLNQLTNNGEVHLLAETRISRERHALNGVTVSPGGSLLCVLESHLALSSVVLR